MHIVTYRCEHCRATATRSVGEHTDGMCRSCGYPMRIDDLFSDRRFATLPVAPDRRGDAEEKAA